MIMQTRKQYGALDKTPPRVAVATFEVFRMLTEVSSDYRNGLCLSLIIPAQLIRLSPPNVRRPDTALTELVITGCLFPTLPPD